MFTHRIVYNFKEPVHNCLTLEHMSWINKIHIKGFQICSTARYYINTSDKNHNNHLKSFSLEHAENIGRTFLLQGRHILHKTVSNGYCTNLHHNLHKLKELDESSVVQLHNIYQNVGNAFKHKEPLRLQISQKDKNWCVELSVVWPNELKFSAIAPSKRVAKRMAAAKCLHWLAENGYLRNGKPKLYTDTEVSNMLLQDKKLNIKPVFIDKIRRLIKIYNMDIRSVIENAQGEGIEPKFTNMELYNDVNSDQRINPFSENKIILSVEEENQIQLEFSAKAVYRNANLPICEIRNDILSLLRDNQVLVIQGDTGCGKTTQVPQCIFDDAIKNGTVNDCAVVITEPRRISAISLAERIADERNETVGETIGYEVRLNKILPRLHCGMLFCTTGILLRKLQINPDLRGFSHVIIDEAHERSIQIDMLLALLKRSLERNLKLRVIIMSAMINTEAFTNYFKCPLIEVSGRMYPVSMHFYDDIEKCGIVSRFRNIESGKSYTSITDYNNITRIIAYICMNKPEGAILCFLPGWGDILQVQDALHKLHMNNITIYLVHSKMTHDVQQKIFEPTKPGIRKVILATNIAETGITISDVRYVVDSAVQNITVWNENMTMTCTRSGYVSQANIKQRKGRAGRVQSGESYHCITRQQYESLPKYPVPEVHTIPLENSVLLSKSYTDKKALEFFDEMLEPPPLRAILTAVENLVTLGALEQNENLTPLGKRLILFSIHPIFSKALVYSAIFQCVNPMLTIVAAFSSQNNIFMNALLDKRAVKNSKDNYHSTSDHLAPTRLYDKWKMCNNPEEQMKFCQAAGLSVPSMRFLDGLREIFMKDLISSRMVHPLHEFGIDSNANYEQMILGVIVHASNQLLQFNRLMCSGGNYVKNTRILLTQLNIQGLRYLYTIYYTVLF